MADSILSEYPAADGTRPVTERDARICRERGHALHTSNGVPTGFCARCGDPFDGSVIKVSASVTVPDAPEFLPGMGVIILDFDPDGFPQRRFGIVREVSPRTVMVEYGAHMLACEPSDLYPTLCDARHYDTCSCQLGSA